MRKTKLEAKKCHKWKMRKTGEEFIQTKKHR